MIEFLMIGTVFTYKQFKEFIRVSFEAGRIRAEQQQNRISGCDSGGGAAGGGSTSANYSFSRKEFMSIFLYQYLMGLFLMIVLIYGLFAIDFAQILWKKSKNVEFSIIDRLMTMSPRYRTYISTDNYFMRKVFGSLFASFVANLLIVHTLILFRKSEHEQDERKVEVDHNVITICTVFVHIITYLLI